MHPCAWPSMKKWGIQGRGKEVMWDRQPELTAFRNGAIFLWGNGRFPPKDFLFVVGKLTSPSLSPLGLSVVRAECHLLVD